MRSLIALVAALALLVPAIAEAASCRQTTIADLEDEVMCPVCGTTLGLAREAPLAKRERALIARLIDSCRSKQEIKDELVAEFGPAILAEPPSHGIGAAAYVLPLAVGALTLGGVLLAFGRWRRRALEAELEELR